MRRGRCTTREGCEPGDGTLGEVVGGGVGAAAGALGAHVVHLGHLMMCLLLGIEHHVLVGPLSELCVGGVVIGHLALLGMRGVGVHGIGLLMGILIEGWVELLGGRVPWLLLLLLDAGKQESSPDASTGIIPEVPPFLPSASVMKKIIRVPARKLTLQVKESSI